MAGQKRINLIDCSLRDGHQSLLATRMSTEQCLRVLPLLVRAGHNVIELWGGATLDSALRFTNDDPFDRLDKFRDVLRTEVARTQWGASVDNSTARSTTGKVQIRSLCRGQNLFGYNPYPDNVVLAFLKEAVRSANTKRTIHRMRIFDALNDARNLVTAIMATKTFDGHAEAAISYTTSPVHDTDHFLRFARQVMDAGADSLAIKDMAGLLHPVDAFTLVEALKEEFPETELTLHSHNTNGLATASYVAAMIAGVDYVDTCYGPMAGATSQPPAELVGYFAQELGLSTNVDFSLAPQIDEKLRTIRKELAAVDAAPNQFGNPWPLQPTDAVRAKVRKAIELLKKRDRASCDAAIAIIEDEIMVPQGYPAVDRKQLEAQVPGGMISNLRNQLKEQGKLDLLPQILEEVPRVRKAAGYVPLVTPTSQIVGTQAAFNVMQGAPYAFVSEPFRDLMMGKYGKLPGPADPQVLAAVSQGREPLLGRPSDHVPDTDLDALIREHGPLIHSNRDALLLVLFAAPAKAFLTKRSQPGRG